MSSMKEKKPWNMKEKIPPFVSFHILGCLNEISLHQENKQKKEIIEHDLFFIVIPPHQFEYRRIVS